MRNFDNVNIDRLIRLPKKFFLFSFLLLVSAVGFFILGSNAIEKAEKNVKELHEIIISEDKVDQMSYINVVREPYRFAEYTDEPTKGYYIVDDGKYWYVVYMKDALYYEINWNQISKDNPYKFEGVTVEVAKDVKKIAINFFNEGLKEDEKLSLVDYDNYFGEVALDVTAGKNGTIGGGYFALGFLSIVVSLVLFVVSFVKKINFNRSLKKINDSEFFDIKAQVNDPDSFFYKSCSLYLTKDYIINFKGKMKIIKYSDIIWAYLKTFTYNGVTTSSIIIYDKIGHKYEIVGIVTTLSKNNKSIYQEIWDTIISKNKEMAVGYDYETKKMMLDVVKKLKKSKF